MFLKRFHTFARHCFSTVKLFSSRLSQRFNSCNLHLQFLKATPLLFYLTPSIIGCTSSTDDGPQIQEINKLELVEYLHRQPAFQFVVIIYDKFKRLNEKEFGEELKPMIDQCKKAKIQKIYLIDSKEKEHLKQIVRLLKNIPNDDDTQIDEDQNAAKKKPFEVYFKSKFYSQAIELQKIKQQPISKQIQEIRHFQFVSNPEKLTSILIQHMNNPYAFNKTFVVRQCISEGQCVQSYKRQVKALIEQGLLTGKKQQFQFELVVDQPSGILGSSSEYIKSFVKEAEKLKGKSISPNRKEETYVFRKDLLGSDVTLFSEWVEREGNAYRANDRFFMFLRPRMHIISKMNTLTDLMWFIRTARTNDQPSISLNNTPKFASSNSQQSLQVLKMAHKSFPSLNYLIASTDKVGELMRHLHADHKYVIFKQDSSIIWKKQFLDIESLQKEQNVRERERIFQMKYKDIIQNFIDRPEVKNLVQVEKELEIGLQKLIILKNRQQTKLNLRKYVIRVCKGDCGRYLTSAVRQAINEELQEPVNVYWIDSTVQNIGVPEGDYILKDGSLEPLQQFLLGG